MRVYKDKQFLVFELDDGGVVKYDFALKLAIGKSGKYVKDLKTQLRGLELRDIYENCTDQQYAKFLRFIKHENPQCSNIGTLLSMVNSYQRFEQLFSAGFDEIEADFKYAINDIPKGLIKICKANNSTPTNEMVKCYKENPDTFNLAYKMKFVSLNLFDIKKILLATDHDKIYYGNRSWEYKWVEFTVISRLISEFGYTAKALFNYVDYLVTFEALHTDNIMQEIYDYAKMMNQISPKFDKHPRHFLTTHAIASRNYNRLKQKFDEEKFAKTVDTGMEKTFGDYTFICPKTTQDIKDEAVMQNNCVASYIQKVIDGGCHILFMRHTKTPNESLVTIEVIDGKIVQAGRRFNDPVTFEQSMIIEKWNKWYASKVDTAA